MSSFVNKKMTSTDVNNGQQYENNDGITPNDLNSIVEGVMYLNDNVSSMIAINKSKKIPISIETTASLPSTGNTNTYLVTATNHWYYWDDTTWADGGVYQATEIADGSIGYAKLDESTQGKLFDSLSNVGNSIVYIKNILAPPYNVIKVENGIVVGNGSEKLLLHGNQKRPKYVRKISDTVSEEKEIAMVDDVQQVQLQQANIMEALKGYVLETHDEIYKNLSTATITNSVTINNSTYNYSDGTRAGLVSIEGNTKKSENLVAWSLEQGSLRANTSKNFEDNKTSADNRIRNSFQQLFKSGTYTLSCALGYECLIQQYSKNTNLYLTQGGYRNNQTITLSEETYLAFMFKKSNNSNFTPSLETLQPMLVEGSVAHTTFVQGYEGLKSVYTEGISLENASHTESHTISVSRTELYGVGTAKDKIYISKYSDGSYRVYLTRNVGTRDYQNGDESDSSVLTDKTITYYPLSTPTTTEIGRNLTYEQVTAICRNGGTISNLGNNNAYAVKPDVTIKRIYRLWNEGN